MRHAVRVFRKQPAFAATAVLTLALGIGATAAICGVVYGVLLRPLPFQEPDRLVALLHHAPREVVGVSGPERDDGLTQPATKIVYWPMLNESYRWRTMAFAVRSTRVGAPGFLRELQQAVWSINPDLPLALV